MIWQLFWKRKRATMTDEPPSWRQRAQNLIEIQLARFPFIIQLRATWRLLREERADWPWLLPLLAFVFITTYRRERQRLRRA